MSRATFRDESLFDIISKELEIKRKNVKNPFNYTNESSNKEEMTQKCQVVTQMIHYSGLTLQRSFNVKYAFLRMTFKNKVQR